MAPEQLDGLAADARSDQFAFAVALWEALYGNHPLALTAGTVEELQEKMRGGDNLEVPSGAVPSRVGRALVRALAPSPPARWPTLPALLDELEAALPRRRPWLYAGAAMVVLAAAAAVVAAYAMQTRSSENRAAAAVCGGGETAFDAVWSDARRVTLREAMIATGLSYAPGVHDAVTSGIASWRQSWLSSRERACKASAVFHEESADVGTQRMHCFARQLDQLEATLGQLQRPDAAALRSARAAVGNLGDPLRCERDAAATLDEPVLSTSAAILAEGSLRVQQEAEAANYLGRYAAAVPLAQVAMALAAAAGSPRHGARASYNDGVASTSLLGASKTVALFERTRRLADAAGDDEVRAKALIELAAGRYALEEYPTSLGYLDEADAVLVRLDARRELRARAAGLRGLIEVELGQMDAAIAHGETAVRLLEERGKPEDLPLGMEVMRLASATQRARDYTRTLALLERSVGIFERVNGGDHPTVSTALSTMGGVLIQLERPADAIPVLERSLAIRAAFFGEDHPSVAPTLQNLGAAYRQTGQLDLAEARVTRALALMRTRKELDYAISAALSSLGSLKVSRGAPRDAVPLYEESLARMVARGHGDTSNAADVHFKLGRALWLSKLDRARARREAASALAIYARAPDLAEHAAEIAAWLKAPDSAATPHFP
jgi:tetratricopeptide (TPR) repeat protein